MMDKNEYHNRLNILRIKTFSNTYPKMLLQMFEEEATKNKDFYKKFSNWLSDNGKYSTSYLRDELALKFKKRFKNKKDFLAWDNAWGWLDTYKAGIEFEKVQGSLF